MHRYRWKNGAKAQIWHVSVQKWAQHIVKVWYKPNVKLPKWCAKRDKNTSRRNLRNVFKPFLDFCFDLLPSLTAATSTIVSGSSSVATCRWVNFSLQSTPSDKECLTTATTSAETISFSDASCADSDTRWCHWWKYLWRIMLKIVPSVHNYGARCSRSCYHRHL